MDLIGKKISFKVPAADSSEDAQSQPKLLSFPSGVPQDTESAELFVWRKKSGSKVKQTLTCESDGIIYRGTDFGSGSGASADAFNYAIGVYDKNSHSMTLVPAHHPFSMSRLPLKDTSSDAVSSMTAWERRSALTEEFGSRKRKRAAKAAESNIISIENISGAAVVEANMIDRVAAPEDGVKVSSAAELALSEQRLLLLPTFNELATELAEAYPLDAIISEDLRLNIEAVYDAKLKQLETGSIELSSKESWISHFFPNSSGEYLASLISDNIVQTMTKHKKSNKFRTCGLLYLDMLLNFYIVTNSSSSTKKSDLLSKFSWPESVVDHIAQKFALIKRVKNEHIYQRNKQQRYLFYTNIILKCMCIL